MVTYKSSGSLTTVEKSYSRPQTPDLTGLAYTLNGETITVDVVGSPGEAGEETVTQSLGGATSYDLTWSSAHSDFEVVFNLSTSDTSQTPTVDDLTLTGGPDAPTGLTVTQVSDTPDVSLSWGDVSTEDEYRVYRATSPGSTLADYTQIDTVSADTTTYTDTGVSLGTRYYYRVSAANSAGESSGSSEVRGEPNDDDLTESIAWDSETEWGYGSFTDTSTDGSGNLTLAERSTDLSFSYDISITTGASTDDATVQVLDQSDTVLAEAEVTGNSSDTGTLTVDASNAGVLTLAASGEANDSTGTSDASISDNFGHTVSISTSGAFTSSEETYDYTYPESGTWTSPYWDYTTVTTASRIINSSTQPATTAISAVVEPEGGTASSSVALTAGSSVLDSVDVGANDRYRLVVTLETDIVDDTTPTPTLDLVELEAHTPTTGHTIVDTRSKEVDLSWDEISVSDGYEVYYSTTTPVTSSDTLGFDITNSSTTSGTVTGLSQGTTYYFNVRTQYSGE